MAWWKCKDTFKGYINVHGIANAIVTATTGTSSYSATADANGDATITVRKKGAYTITSNSTLMVARATVTDKLPVTATYTWRKWNSKEHYAQATQEVAQGTREDGSTGGTYMLATGYSFDDTTGSFTLTGGQYAPYTIATYKVGAYAGSASAARYCCSRGAGPTVTSFYDCTSAYNCISNNNAIQLWQSRLNVTSAGTVKRYSYLNGYIKGDTDYGTVTSSDINAHPSNGRDSTDGYWYVHE